MIETTVAILNAHVITLNAKQPRAEAIAIYNGNLVAVGTSKQIRKWVGKKTIVIDAKGKTIVPGLTDCHVHMIGFGHSLQTLELRNARSIKEVQKRLCSFAERNRNKSWVLGGRWDQGRFSENRYPTRWDLDSVVADRPVFLMRVCGHVCVVNSMALKLAKITKRTTVKGGKVDFDKKTGEPNGILRENAINLVSKVVPKHNPRELEEACMSACQTAVEAGLTCVHWMISSAEEVRILQKLRAEGKLPLRVYLGIPVEFLDELTRLGFLTGFGNDMAKIGFIKILADGSLGGHTAALNEPYADKPETCGIMLYEQKELNKLILNAHEADLQLAVHAIGDYAMNAVLRAYEKALNKKPKEKHRHRVEHCSVLNPKFIKRMKQLNLIASVQPHFVVSDFWATDRVGKIRARWVYPFRTLMHEGLTVASGSDCPVEPISPILGIWAAVTRKSFPEESLTAEEALKTYTINAAYASFDECKRGTIEAGKLADLTILSDDLLTISPDKVKEISVEMTIVDGKVVYSKEPFQAVR